VFYIAKLRRALGGVLLVFGLLAASGAGAQDKVSTTRPDAAPSAPLAAPVSKVPAYQPIRVPRIQGRLDASVLGVVINLDDPYSVVVGEFYVQQRAIPEAHVLRVHLPRKSGLSLSEFEALREAVAGLPSQVQALALVWKQPYAVECNSITAALTLGFQAALCQSTCAASRLSPYFNHPSAAPWTDLHLRPSMLLAADSVEQGRALVLRGVQADHSLSRKGAPQAQAYFISTPDAARNVRERIFPPPVQWPQLRVVRSGIADVPPLHQTLIYQTGLVHVPGLESVQWLPGALADHLTSTGGVLDAQGPGAQMSVMAWLASGATASYGTVSEPCNHLQKFPHPQVLLLNYLQGATALEAYWRSVAWPAQGVFVGEPLAAPFAPPDAAVATVGPMQAVGASASAALRTP